MAVETNESVYKTHRQNVLQKHADLINTFTDCIMQLNHPQIMLKLLENTVMIKLGYALKSTAQVILFR